MVHLGKFILSPYIFCNSLVAQTVKNLPAMQETQVPSLGREDLVQKEIASNHFKIVLKKKKKICYGLLWWLRL